MLRPTPQHHGVGTPFLRHFLDGKYGSVGDMPGHSRWAIVDELSAYARPQAIRADERRTFKPFTGLGVDDHLLADVGVAIDRLRCAEADEGRAPTGVQQYLVEVCPIDHGIR